MVPELNTKPVREFSQPLSTTKVKQSVATQHETSDRRSVARTLRASSALCQPQLPLTLSTSLHHHPLPFNRTYQTATMSSRVGLRFLHTFRQTIARRTANTQQTVSRRTYQSAAETNVDPPPAQSKFAQLMNSPVGPKTVHFWAPIMKVRHENCCQVTSDQEEPSQGKD